LAIPPDEVLYRLSWKEICRLLNALVGEEKEENPNVQKVNSLADL
jgi:hypothetical protein